MAVCLISSSFLIWWKYIFHTAEDQSSTYQTTGHQVRGLPLGYARLFLRCHCSVVCRAAQLASCATTRQAEQKYDWEHNARRSSLACVSLHANLYMANMHEVRAGCASMITWLLEIFFGPFGGASVTSWEAHLSVVLTSVIFWARHTQLCAPLALLFRKVVALLQSAVALKLPAFRNPLRT